MQGQQEISAKERIRNSPSRGLRATGRQSSGKGTVEQKSSRQIQKLKIRVVFGFTNGIL
jgi:hypothetical protein